MANSYILETINPMDVALRGFQGIQAIRQMQGQSALLQAQQEEAQARAAAVQQEMRQAQENAAAVATLYDEIKGGTMRPESVFRVIQSNPALAGALENLRKGMSQDQITADFDVNNNLLTAAELGDLDRAKGMIDQQIAAYENAGDTQKAGAARAMRQLLATDPIQFKEAISLNLASLDPDRFKKRTEAIQTYRLAPGELEKQKGELAQQAAELGLTDAQTKKVLRDVAETNARIAAIAAQAEAAKNAGGGIVPPEDRFKAETDLRKEYQNRSARFTEAYISFQNLTNQVALGTAAGDTAAIKMLEKILDPGSVVREAEFAQRRGSLGDAFDQLDSLTRSLRGKGLLTPRQRQELEASARLFIESAVKLEREERANFDRMVNDYGLNPRNIFSTVPVEVPTPTTPPAQPAAPASAPAAPRSQAAQIRAFGGNRLPPQRAAPERDEIVDVQARPRT